MVRKRSISVTASLEPPRHTSLLEPRQLPLTLTRGPYLHASHIEEQLCK